MSDLVQAFGNQFCKEKVPKLRAGYLVKVHQKIKEGNKERVQIFQGTVIRTNSGHGVNETFAVRKISEGVGVEKIFPLHSPSIVKIEVLRAHKVRRANLNYLRDLSGKALRMKEIPLKLKEKLFAKPEVKEATPEASESPVAQEEAVVEEKVKEAVVVEESTPEVKEETSKKEDKES